MSDFPQEVQDAIIEHLHDDPKALKLCAQVSHPWAYSARRWIFHTFVLGPRSQHGELVQLFQTQPHISRYVKTLVIEEGDPFFDVELDEDEEPEPSWIEDCILLLSMMDQVERLELLIFNWTQFSMELRHTVSVTFHRVKKLVLVDGIFSVYGDLDEFMTFFPLLEEMKVDSIMWEGETNFAYFEDFGGRSGRTIRSLQCANTIHCPVFRSLSNDFTNISSLHTLQVHFGRIEDLKSTCAMLKVLGSSLKRLKVEFDTPWWIHFDSPSDWIAPVHAISQNSALQSFSFTQKLVTQENFIEIPMLPSFLSFISSVHLENVLIRLTIRHDSIASFEQQWRNIDFLLAGILSQSLRCVTLIVLVNNLVNSKDLPGIHDLFRKHLSSLHKSGLLRVSSSECDGGDEL